MGERLNYMRKMNSQPSPMWTVKKDFLAREKLKMEQKRQEEALRTKTEKEKAEVDNKKVLLDDEKAKIDAPGVIREENTINLNKSKSEHSPDGNNEGSG